MNSSYSRVISYESNGPVNYRKLYEDSKTCASEEAMIIDDAIPGPSPATEPSAVFNCSTISRASTALSCTTPKKRGIGNLNSVTRNFLISKIRKSGKKKQGRRFSLDELL
ncbi:hypothetical protein CBL_11485 [Carabus blaptoides fortunei]